MRAQPAVGSAGNYQANSKPKKAGLVNQGQRAVCND
jgi:hypothetical protein